MSEQHAVYKMDLQKVGRRIQKSRENEGMTRAELARRLQVTDEFVAAVERGEKSLSLKNFHLLVQILDISADYLLRSQRGSEEEKGASLHLTLTIE